MYEDRVIFKTLYQKIQQCASIDEKTLTNFLLKTFDDLVFTFDENENKDGEGINQEILTQYLDIPLVVSNKIFDSFLKTKNSKKILNKPDFVTGILNLYFGSLESLKIKTFKVFDIGGTGKMLKEDVHLILDYLNTSNDLMIVNLENYIEKFFDRKNYLTQDEFRAKIEYINSDLMIIFLILLFNRQPFTEEALEYFKQNCQDREDESIDFASKVSDDMDGLICKPSNELNYYLKIVGKPTIGIKRKASSKKVSSSALKNNFDSNDSLSGEDYRITRANSSFINLDVICNINNFNTDQHFTYFAYQFNSHNRLKKCKLVLVEKDLFVFRYSSTAKKFIFIRVLPLSEYYVTSCDPATIKDRVFYPFAFLRRLGNTITHITNLFFMKIETEALQCISQLQASLNFRDIFNDYEISEDLGKGNFGVVKTGRNKITGETVAVKIYDKCKMTKSRMEMVRNEVDVMKYLKHHENPNVVKTIDVFEDKFHIYILMECLKGKSLDSYLISRGNLLSDDEIKNVALQIGNALEFLHKNGIAHRDIKLDNVMLSSVDDLYNIKIVDFGLSKIFTKNESINECVGTLTYSAPEVLKKIPYNHKGDVWSLGVLIYFLLTTEYPFNDNGLEYSKTVHKICEHELTFPKQFTFNAEIKSFIRNCLQKSNANRPNISQILNLGLLSNNINNGNKRK